jgi:hypothetical protein
MAAITKAIRLLRRVLLNTKKLNKDKNKKIQNSPEAKAELIIYYHRKN